jgi:vacuolar-type H+-ATPase subunit E/Vma4
MSIENILNRIREEAEASGAEVLRQAEERSAAIRAEHAKKAERLRAELEARARARAADEERRLVVAEELELRKAHLVRRREILEEVYAAARERIVRLAPNEYLDLVRSLIVRHALSGKEEVVVPAAQREIFTPAFIASLDAARGAGAAFTLAAEPGDFAWGVDLREGRRRVDLTLETVFEQLKARIEPAVAGALFPE